VSGMEGLPSSATLGAPYCHIPRVGATDLNFGIRKWTQRIRFRDGSMDLTMRDIKLAK
jgi:hypothetical protein